MFLFFLLLIINVTIIPVSYNPPQDHCETAVTVTNLPTRSVDACVSVKVIHVHLQDAGSKCLLIGQEGKVAILPMRQRKGGCKLWNVFLFCKLSKPSAVDCFHAATGCCVVLSSW